MRIVKGLYRCYVTVVVGDGHVADLVGHRQRRLEGLEHLGRATHLAVDAPDLEVARDVNGDGSLGGVVEDAQLAQAVLVADERHEQLPRARVPGEGVVLDPGAEEEVVLRGIAQHLDHHRVAPEPQHS